MKNNFQTHSRTLYFFYIFAVSHIFMKWKSFLLCDEVRSNLIKYCMFIKSWNATDLLINVFSVLHFALFNFFNIYYALLFVNFALQFCRFYFIELWVGFHLIKTLFNGLKLQHAKAALCVLKSLQTKWKTNRSKASQ